MKVRARQYTFLGSTSPTDRYWQTRDLGKLIASFMQYQYVSGSLALQRGPATTTRGGSPSNSARAASAKQEYNVSQSEDSTELNAQALTDTRAKNVWRFARTVLADH